MVAANVDQELDSIVPDTQCNECNELEAPRCENEVVNNSTKSQTDFNKIVSSCILCSNKDNKFMVQHTKCNSWLHSLLLYKFTKLSSTDVLDYPKKVYLLPVYRSV